MALLQIIYFLIRIFLRFVFSIMVILVALFIYTFIVIIIETIKHGKNAANAAKKSIKGYKSIEKDLAHMESSEKLLKEYKEKCINLGLKLDAATESLKHYQSIEKDFEAKTKCDCDLKEEHLNQQRLRAETEYREKCFEWEKVKQNLISKLDAATESLQRYESIQKDYVEDRLKWDVEKKNLRIEIESSEQLLKEYKDKCLNLGLKLDAATQSLESYQANEKNRHEESEDRIAELEAAKKSLESISDKLKSVNTSLEHYEKIYDDHVKDLEEKCVKQRVEKTDLFTKLCTEIKSSQALQHLLQEYKDKCLVLEEEKQNLISKLDVATDSLEYYRGIKMKEASEELAAARESLQIKSFEPKDVTVELEDATACLESDKTRYENLGEERLKWESEKKDLCTEIESSQSLKQLLQESEDKCLKLGLMLDAATDYGEYYQAIVNDQLEKNEDLCAELVLTKASLKIKSDKLEAVNASLQDYQKRYEDVVKDFGEERVKWDEERTGLAAKISENDSWFEHYKSSICDLTEERNNLSAKVSELESADHYRKLVNEYDEKFRSLEEEKNDLVSEVSAAKEACQHYRSYFQDFTLTPK